MSRETEKLQEILDSHRRVVFFGGDYFESYFFYDPSGRVFPVLPG